MGIKEARKKIDAFIKRYSLTMNEFLDLMDEHSFADETPTGKVTSTILTQSICDAHMTYMNSEGWSFIGGTVLWRKINGEIRYSKYALEDLGKRGLLVNGLPKREVWLDFKCDSFVSVETTLTPEEAESMTEDGMDALRVKYQREARELYQKRMLEDDFTWELAFHVKEADGEETQIKI